MLLTVSATLCIGNRHDGQGGHLGHLGPEVGLLDGSLRKSTLPHFRSARHSTNRPIHALSDHQLWGVPSVHFLSQTIDHKVFQYLGCRNDNQPILEW